MPFRKTKEVFSEFIRQFLSGTTKKPVPGDSRAMYSMLPIEGKDFHVRYYKRSGQTGMQDLLEVYPCIVIQDFVPRVDKNYMHGQTWIQGAIDLLNGTREIIYLPVRMIMQFSVTVTTSGKDNVNLQDAYMWFLAKFDWPNRSAILMNKYTIPDEGDIGDVVPFTCRETEVPRNDGRTEYMFDFTLYPVIHAKLPSSAPYTNQITLSLTNNDVEAAFVFISEVVTPDPETGLPSSEVVIKYGH